MFVSVEDGNEKVGIELTKLEGVPVVHVAIADVKSKEVKADFILKATEQKYLLQRGMQLEKTVNKLIESINLAVEQDRL